MNLLVLNHSEVEDLLPMDACITVMEKALAALARGLLYQPLRKAIVPPGASGLLGLMPAYRPGHGQPAAFGLKAVGIFPDNVARGIDSHQGAVLLFSGETGELMALMNGAAVTAIRTAAVSAVATRLLAREQAGDLALIGSGVQARTHLEAMACVRPIRRARVASRRLESARRFASEMAGRYPFPIEAVAGAEQAVRDADLIVTVTSSAEPVVERSWIAPGAHLNVVGSSTPRAREVGSATMAAASLFVDLRESTLNESGEYLSAVREGVIGPDSIRGEIGEVLIGTAAGRTSPEEITLFKSLGLAIEDLAVAEYLHGEAREKKRGTWIPF
jgi:ornithine cyclodeaminase